MTAAARPRPGGWAEELSDLSRAATGGMLFGVPLLYTMEMYWAGDRVSPQRAVVMLIACFALLVVLHRTAGFRKARDLHLVDAVEDAVVALGLSLVLVTIVLVAIREITVDTPRGVALGKAAFQALPFSVWASASPGTCSPRTAAARRQRARRSGIRGRASAAQPLPISGCR